MSHAGSNMAYQHGGNFSFMFICNPYIVYHTWGGGFLALLHWGIKCLYNYKLNDKIGCTNK